MLSNVSGIHVLTMALSAGNILGKLQTMELLLKKRQKHFCCEIITGFLHALFRTVLTSDIYYQSDLEMQTHDGVT